MNKRERAAEAYVQALRTGETSATAAAAGFLAKDVVLHGASWEGDISGYDDVLARITGQWPNTPVFVKEYWSAPQSENGGVKVGATFPGMGAAPAAVNLTFSFNGKDEISRVDQETTAQPRAEQTDTIPDTARGTINGALANDTPMSVAYVDEDGRPNLSLRGSVQVYSPTQLSIWVRDLKGGLPTAIKKNPSISLLYRDSATRTTLLVRGKGHVEEDKETCDRVWGLIPDVEQKHETHESGAALIIDVKSLTGGTPRGGVRMMQS